MSESAAERKTVLKWYIPAETTIVQEIRRELY